MSYLEKFYEWLATQDKEEIFKTPLGRFRTQSLFYELTRTKIDELKPIFTIKPRHHKDYWSFPLLYLELADPTEYLVGETIFYNYEHWCRLITAKGFKPTVNKVRNELELKIRAKSLQQIQAMANAGKGTSSLSAAKILLDRGWMSKNEQKTKLAIKRDEQFKEVMEEELNEDYKLIEILNGQTSAN